MTPAARTTLRAALADAGIEPCADNSCMFGSPGGMSTNGGCQCLDRAGLDGLDYPSTSTRRYIRRLASACRALASGAVTPPAAVERQWIYVTKHLLTADMGPVEIQIYQRYSAIATGADEWSFAVWLRSSWTEIVCGHYRGKGAPLERCKADAIAAVERWRDQIR